MNSPNTKNIAVVVYDNNRSNLIEWTYFNRENLRWHRIIANDATAAIVGGTLNIPVVALPEDRFGSYNQISEMIGNGSVDMLICIGDPTNTNTGIEALIRLATINQVIVASSQSTANFLLSLIQLSNQPAESQAERVLTGINHQPGAYAIN
jgi:methylglyoxal synthase